jgi:hypothetical protein
MRNHLMVVPGDRAGLPAEARANAVALCVLHAMHEVLVSCARPPGELHEDRVVLLQMWSRETSEFEPEIVVEALRSLLRHNPNDPFRPTIEVIRRRCQMLHMEWADRVRAQYLGTSNEKLPAWCARITHEALAWQLKAWTVEATVQASLTRSAQRYPPEFKERDKVGWFIASKIGNRLSDWPQDLLREFGVPSGGELEHLSDIVVADRERRERREREERERVAAEREETVRAKQLRQDALAAALARPDVQQLLETKQATESRGHRTNEARRARDAFATVYRQAAIEELKARGLTEHHL